ncbi:hypothetical protein FRC04_000961 [Tulasnella sp. 424]|nr:hypothetical protein FRC04_000961 [Tulasnella sp. 424]KAG8977874.1 hypothetical protein FRC05_000402 [Tulasnella sp. 425]
MSSLPIYSRVVHNLSDISLNSAPPLYQANSEDVTLEFSPSHRFSPASPPENASSRPSSSHSSRLSFTIGRKQTIALVNPSDLKAHLVILRAFHRLRQHVYSATRKATPSSSDAALQQAWEVFLARAVWRFELWLKHVVARPTRDSMYAGPVNTWLNLHEVPPIDVVMVWHSYLLHPRTYFEDGLRYNTGLLSRGSFPLHEIAVMIENEDPPRPGSAAQTRAYYWESCTRQPWQLSPCLEGVEDGISFISIDCPACTSEVTAPWFSEDGTGWAQRQFKAYCANCGMQVTKESLAVLKFSEDLRKVVEEPKRRTLATLHLHEETGKPFIAAALLFNQNLVEDLERSSFQPDARAYAAQELRWSVDKVAARCRAGFRTTAYMKQYREDGKAHQGLKGLQRMMEAYTTPGPYSIDLVKAVQRQMKFVESMADIGWTQSGRFDSNSDELALKRAIAGYHAFLDIMAQNPDAFLVPTLSIDLAWHTHQLLCVNYRESTLDLVGTIVDHDDSVEQETLAAAFDQTARLWSSRFSVPYSTCGCPTIRATKLSTMDSVAKLFSKKGKQKATPTEIENHRPDLVSHHPNDVFETHPSDHSQVKVINSSSIAKQAAVREKSNKRRIEEDKEAVANGTADSWQALAVDARKGKVKSHDPAFVDLLSPDDVLNAKAISMGQCTMVGRIVRPCNAPKLRASYDLGTWFAWEMRRRKQEVEGETIEKRRNGKCI